MGFQNSESVPPKTITTTVIMRHFLVCYDGQVVAQAACASASFMGGQFSLPNHVSVEIHKTPGTASESFDVLFHVTQKESDSDTSIR